MKLLNVLLTQAELEASAESTKGLPLNFSGETFIESLKYMGIGMICIFAVIGVIALGVWVLNRLTKKKKPQKVQTDGEQE